MSGKCKLCGNKTKESRNTFCSWACFKSYVSGIGSKKVTSECQTCGKHLSVYPRQIEHGQGKYCSRSCKAKYRTGERNSNWKGGIAKGPGGRTLVYVPGHHLANHGGGKYALRYRVVAEQKIGRALLPGEDVHHINGDEGDDRPENLQVMSHAKHAGLHSSKR